MVYIAYVLDKKTEKIEGIAPSKKDFRFFLRQCGLSVRFISTEGKYDEDFEKWEKHKEKNRIRNTHKPE